MSKRPRVITRCVANSYAAPNERIVEVSFPSGRGCLIALREHDNESHVDVYRRDAAVLTGAVKEMRETLRDLQEWDGSEDAFATILTNLQAGIDKASGAS